ncbi:hypothetical protein FAM09_10545 [Niastella caeni]|uniref:Uncharacterized protein n=1 Tax=Niastella caeni TaxID=2569763 RepID=A0A4S8HX98_9BACT|nr:hypothetical protein [Niastella caeni]THU40297.1 hypothetical protein FAM09_10545 [Niastella caeni]
MIRWLWIITLWFLAACNEREMQAPLATAVANNITEQATALPEALADHIKTNFSQWHVVEKNDYSKTWWSFYDSSYNPCWARTDINDDQLADYALWLKKDNQLRLVICTGTASHSFANYTVNDLNVPFNEKEHNLAAGIAVAPPAQIDVAYPRIQSLILKSNGFALMELEERTRIYYWENGNLQTFYTK